MPADPEQVIDGLYALPPGDFTRARDEAALNARRGGDRTLAERIKKLRKPNTAAWVADQLVREDRPAMERFTALGESLRQAQQHLEGEQLKDLLVQRRQVVAALVNQAKALARDAGVNLSESAEQELTGTLLAALADPEAARALLTGRLTTALHPGVALPDIVISLAPPVAAGPKTRTRRTAEPTPVEGTAGRHRETERLRRKADRLREEAGQAQEAARRCEESATEAQEQAEGAERDRAEAVRHEHHAKAAVETARAALAEAEAELATAEQARRAADAAVGPARARAERAAKDARGRRAAADRLRRQLAELA
ncbi:hypothetical protein [Kitasatospora sp. CMC57]|uniref:hypothetical protein n=1 Tax=Kitasatospora sp. CMC57 TaxID=3231513 RepID=UPI0038B6952B